MFTLEKTSNEVPYNLRELLNQYLRWSRSRAKVTAPAPEKYPGSGTLIRCDLSGYAVNKNNTRTPLQDPDSHNSSFDADPHRNAANPFHDNFNVQGTLIRYTSVADRIDKTN